MKVREGGNRVNYHGVSITKDGRFVLRAKAVASSPFRLLLWHYVVQTTATVAEQRPYFVRASATFAARATALFAFLLFTFYLSCPAQDGDYELAPPPLKFVAKDDKERLESQADLKSRTKLALELMDQRLAEGERLNSSGNFDGLFRELGRFRGLVDYTFGFLGKNDPNNKKVLDNYKRLEISLRSFMSRVEVIHRELPFKYEEYVRGLVKYLRVARTKALDPQFGDTVLPGDKPSD